MIRLITAFALTSTLLLVQGCSFSPRSEEKSVAHFMTSFPQPGKYKLWGQFNRNGRIITADFWVNVI